MRKIIFAGKRGHKDREEDFTVEFPEFEEGDIEN